jgi:hypothetical protein
VITEKIIGNPDFFEIRNIGEAHVWRMRVMKALPRVDTLGY